MVNSNIFETFFHTVLRIAWAVLYQWSSLNEFVSDFR